MLRTAQSLPQEWAFDTGLRPRPLPDEAASLLPGPLAATRTGLTPASDDELTTQDQPPTRSTSCPWAHGKGSLSRWSRQETGGPPRGSDLPDRLASNSSYTVRQRAAQACQVKRSNASSRAA